MSVQPWPTAQALAEKWGGIALDILRLDADWSYGAVFAARQAAHHAIRALAPCERHIYDGAAYCIRCGHDGGQIEEEA